jgi:hypothetical protein
MKDKTNKFYLTLMLSISILSGSVVMSVPVHATDTPLTIVALSKTNMTTMKTYIAGVLPSWYNDYKYFVYFTTVWKVMLVPKANYSAVIFGDNQVDQPYEDDIDIWKYQITCTTISPCKVYQFTTGFAYNGNYDYTTNQDSLINFSVAYTNFVGETYTSWVVPPYQQTTIRTSLNLTNFGLNMFPTDWTQTWGYTAPTTDEVQTRALIESNWGIWNFARDFFNAMYIGTLDTIDMAVASFNEGWAQGILWCFGVPAEASNNLFQWLANLMPAWLSEPIDMFNQFVGGFFTAIYEITIYILYRSVSFLVAVGTAIVSGLIPTLLALPASFNSITTYLPTPVATIFGAGISIFTISSAVRFVWYIASFGGKT